MSRALSVAILVPWRDKGDLWRRHNLDVVLNHILGAPSTRFHRTELYVSSDGREGSAPFNRSAAYNEGIRLHPDVDVFVFHEADMLIDHTQLHQAVQAATAQRGLVVPFDTYNYLTCEDTERVHVRQADPSACEPEYVMANGRSNGAVNVVSAATMAAVGQWDETFEGWGFDDRAMATAFEIATGNPTRYISGLGVHLWHMPGWSTESRFHGGAADVPPHEHAATLANERRYRQYCNARTPERIRELTAGA